MVAHTVLLGTPQGHRWKKRTACKEKYVEEERRVLGLTVQLICPLCACMCVCSRPPPPGKVAQLSTSRQSLPLSMSPAAAHSVILSQRPSRAEITPFPSHRYCTCRNAHARSKPFLSTAARSHTPVSNPSLFSYFLRHTSKPVLTWTRKSLRKSAISAHFTLLSLTCFPSATLQGHYLHLSNHLIDPIQLFKSQPSFLFGDFSPCNSPLLLYSSLLCSLK